MCHLLLDSRRRPYAFTHRPGSPKMSKPRPILLEMPWNVKQMIVESTDNFTRTSLRGTTKALRKMVDNSVIRYHRITLQINHHINTVHLEIKYTPQQIPDFGITFQTISGKMIMENPFGEFEMDSEDGDFLNLLAPRFIKVFRNPKALVRTLHVNVYQGAGDADMITKGELIMSALLAQLSCLPHKINVKKLKLCGKNQDEIARFLQYIKPGNLKSIRLVPGYSLVFRDFSSDTIAGMKQWKKASNLDLTLLKLTLPERDTEHFDSIDCGLETLDLDKIKATIEAILNGATKRTFSSAFDRDAVIAYLSQFQKVPPARDLWREGQIFKICRGAASCVVKVFPLNLMSFYNPDRTTVGDVTGIVRNLFRR